MSPIEEAWNKYCLDKIPPELPKSIILTLKGCFLNGIIAGLELGRATINNTINHDTNEKFIQLAKDCIKISIETNLATKQILKDQTKP